MKFRTHLVLTLSLATALTVTVSFGTATYLVERSEERQLDEALRAEAREEALEIASTSNGALHITDRGGPEADDVGRLTKFAALYGPNGRPTDVTATFAHGVPVLTAVQHPNGVPFDFTYGGQELRAVMIRVPGAQGARLLLAAPRDDLEKDMGFLRRVMLASGLLSIGFTWLATWRIVRRLTRGHEAIAEVARCVASGNMHAHIELRDGDEEVVQLARDVDAMVARLAHLVESQQRFVAHAAHELRSPITALYGELQLALRRSRTPAEYRASIEEALDAARRLKSLAEDLLALARLGSVHELPPKVPVSLAEVACRAALWVSHEVARRSVSLTLEAQGLWVLGHAFDVERLLRNLLDNAVRHSPTGGHVRLEARRIGEVVEIVVLDEGSGVARNERERVFEPFFRAATELPRGGGSGLGLAIVREIARAHGGDVAVVDRPLANTETEAEPNPGACFRVTLRAAPDGAAGGA